jgi:hypothetical protein
MNSKEADAVEMDASRALRDLLLVDQETLSIFISGHSSTVDTVSESYAVHNMFP